MPEKLRATRDGFGEGIVKLARRNKNVFVLSGDLTGSTKADLFQKEFPGRFLNMGICEQDMLGTAVGLSLAGKIPFVCSFSVFVLGRGYDQIRISVCYNNQNVKIIGSHSGITVGQDGATAQSLEDIAMMRVLPNMTVVCPADALEAEKATIALADLSGPAFLRLGRHAMPDVTRKDDPFRIGKANVIAEGKDVAIIACGIMVREALEAREILKKRGIQAMVVNMHTIKPLDGEVIRRAAETCGAIVTAEEHQIYGGLGGAVAEFVSGDCPVIVKNVALNNVFGESGRADELCVKYGLTEREIVESVDIALEMKGRRGR
jgi:transketolase